MKRLFDFVIGLIGLVVLLPVIAILALAVLINMGRPVIFSQLRPGLGGAPFTLYKFRSMKESASGANEHSDDGERLTPFGSFIRNASLDELPELWNVVRGDMSLVGPRPLLMEYLPLYSPSQARRHEVRPGITGWAQVKGRNSLSWDEKFELDVWYVDNQSMWLDIKILFLTASTVLRKDDISHEGEATMKKFSGSGS